MSQAHKLFNRKFFVICSILFWGTLPLIKANSPQITIVWSTENSSSNYNLQNQSGENLSSGSGLNGDGCAVELGYFSQATTSSPFSGNWIPLTQTSSVGDSSTGFGFEDGKFSFSTTFTKDSEFVSVYKSRPAEYSFSLDFQISTSTLPTDTPICIRFYDSSSKNGAARYNTVTGSEWLWPSFPSGSSIPSNLYLMIAPGSPPTGSYWKYGAIFEDSSNPYRTTLLDNFSLSVDVDHTQGYGSGTVVDVNGSNYEGGSFVNLNATAELHSIFFQWIGDDIVDPYSASTQVKITKDQNITAQFLPIPYFLNLESDLNGSVDGGGGFDFGDTTTIEAVPFEGFEFSHWEENGVVINDLNASATVTITGNRELVAKFTPLEFQVTISSNTGGNHELVDSYGFGLDNFYYNSSYSLSVTPDQHFLFSGWSGDSASLSMLEDQNSYYTKLTVEADLNLTAIFSERSYQLNVLGSAGYESLSPESGQFAASSMVDIEAVPRDGYQFDAWVDPYNLLTNPSSAQTEANMSKLLFSSSASVTALFSLVDYNTSQIVISSDGNGSVSLSSDAGKYSHFTSYDLNATGFSGYEFHYWSGEGNQTLLSHGPDVADNKLLIQGPVQLEAKFIPQIYNIEVFSSGGGYTESPSTYTIHSDDTISAIPASGWEFLRWDGDTDYLASPNSASTSLNLSGLELKDISLTAEFGSVSQETTVEVEGNGSISYALDSSSFSSYSSNAVFESDIFTEITILASPDTGWKFNQWAFNSSPVPDYNTISDSEIGDSFLFFYAEIDNNITAVFDILEYNSTEVSISAGSGGNVILEEANSYLHFQTYSMEAIPELGFEFSHWEGDGHENLLHLGTNSRENSITIDGPLSLTAIFNPRNFQINLSAQVGGDVNGSSSFSVLDNPPPTISAIPSRGWDFDTWQGDTSFLLSPNSSQSSITWDNHIQDINISAIFKREIYTLSHSVEGTGLIKHRINEGIWTTPSSENFTLEQNSGDSISLSALAGTGWKFDLWSQIPNPNLSFNETDILDESSPSLSFQAYASGQFTARFSRQEYSLNSPTNIVGGESNVSGSFVYQDLISFNAVSQTGYLFDHWEGNGTEYLKQPVYSASNSLDIPPFDIELIPVFTPIEYQVTLNSPLHGELSIQGKYLDHAHSNGPEFNATSVITLTATPSTSYSFVSWTWTNSKGESGTSSTQSFSYPP